MTITLEQAEQIAEAATERGAKLGKALSIAVVDAGGFMLVVKRSDGARPLTPSIAVTKAYSAAVMQRPTGMLKPWSENNPTFFSQVSTLGHWPIVATDGGMPIKRDGEIIGGLGVSGATSSEDQEVCDGALEALGYDLEFQAWGQPAQR